MTSFNGLLPFGRAFLDQLSSRFWSKALAALGLVMLADVLFLGPSGFTAGSTIGIFGLVLLIFVWALRVPRPQTIDYILGAAALGLCLASFNNPSLLATGLLWVALGILVLRPTFVNPADARDIALRLAVFTFTASVRPLKDLGLLRHASKRNPRPAIRFASFILPVGAVILFGALFVWANPILENIAGTLDAQSLFAVLTLERFFLWALIGIVAWSLLRSSAIHLPRSAHYQAERVDGRIVALFSPASVLAALLLCNAIFALQNGLDVTYLWAGEMLPNGMTHAQYAHRGAYPLILTALLAGAFVLIALRRGSPSEHDSHIRALVYLWLGQNVFLVASAILRTLNYVEDYSLTLLRLSALIWMGLVATGLVLIVLRIARGKSGRWLINANALAAAAVLYMAVFFDLSGFVADYNVRHSYENTGRGQFLDIAYLDELGPAALPALSMHVNRGHATRYNGALAAEIQQSLYLKLQRQQQNWRSWTWAGERLFRSLPTPILKLWKAPARQDR